MIGQQFEAVVFAGGVVDHDHRHLHVDRQSSVVPVAESVVRADCQVHLVRVQVVLERRDRSGADRHSRHLCLLRSDQLHCLLSQLLRPCRHLPGHIQRRPPRHVVDPVVALSGDRVLEAELFSPRIRYADPGHLVPQIVAAQHDQAVLLDEFPLLAGALVAKDLLVFVEVIIEGRLVGDEQVAAQR